MTTTYLDSGVLIAAVRGRQPAAIRALTLLEDGERTFVASAFLRLELLPKAVFHRNRAEVAFYLDFFARVARWARFTDDLSTGAEVVESAHGLNALDALHIAAATALAVEEFVTTEGAHKPIHRVNIPRIVML